MMFANFEFVPGKSTLLLLNVCGELADGVKDALFEASDRIPEHDREVIGAVLQSVLVQSHGPGDGDGVSRVIGHHETGTYSVYVDSLCIPDLRKHGWLSAVLAHEFAHIFLFANKDPSHTAPKPDAPAEQGAWDNAREHSVWCTLQRWGFPMAEHDKAIVWTKAAAL